jgi:hypothetical protein
MKRYAENMNSYMKQAPPPPVPLSGITPRIIYFRHIHRNCKLHEHLLCDISNPTLV